MRRVGELFPGVCSFEALLRAARLAARGKKHRLAVARFLWNLEPELLQLQAELRDGSYRPGESRKFMIHDPKEREISVAPFRDRVVHQVLCGVVAPVLERSAIHHSYACRVGKGTHRAIRQAQRLVRGRAFFLKCDVRRFFASVDHGVLKMLLRRCLKDDRVLDLCDRIIDAGGAEALGGCRTGLPIGNLTSQHLANSYLCGLDHFVLEELRPPGYLRYMDDFLLFDDDRGRLAAMLREVRDWLADRRALCLKEQATLLTRSAAGLPFLGLRIYPGVLRLRRRKARRFVRLLRRRVLEHREGRLTDAALQGSLGSILAHVQPGSGAAFRREVLRSVHFPE
jgi:hypothetical protein